MSTTADRLFVSIPQNKQISQPQVHPSTRCCTHVYSKRQDNTARQAKTTSMLHVTSGRLERPVKRTTSEVVLQNSPRVRCQLLGHLCSFMLISDPDFQPESEPPVSGSSAYIHSCWPEKAKANMKEKKHDCGRLWRMPTNTPPIHMR